jgi:transposase
VPAAALDGVACQVIAPSLIPKASGDKVKTDKRDCQRLARLHRAGELVAIGVPSPLEKPSGTCAAHGPGPDPGPAPALQVLGAPLQGLPRRAPRDREARGWLAAQHFGEPVLGLTFGHYRATVAARDAALAAVEVDLATWLGKAPFAQGVRRLAAYRGVSAMGALALQAEVCDWRRFGRAASFMGFVGLVPPSTPRVPRAALGARVLTNRRVVQQG